MNFKRLYGYNIHCVTVCGEDKVAKEEMLKKIRNFNQIYHKKEKPHKCGHSHCSKRFITIERMEAHVKKDHIEDGDDQDETDSEDDEDEKINKKQEESGQDKNEDSENEEESKEATNTG
jgi:hypothetical protein